MQALFFFKFLSDETEIANNLSGARSVRDFSPTPSAEILDAPSVIRFVETVRTFLETKVRPFGAR